VSEWVVPIFPWLSICHILCDLGAAAEETAER